MSKKSFIDLDLFDDLFEDATPDITATATTWTVKFTSGSYAGYTLTLKGTGLSGSSFLPDTGIVSDITLMDGETSLVAITGLSIEAARLLKAADLEDDEDEDDEDDEDEDDDDILCGDDDDDVRGGIGDDDIYGGTGDDSLSGGANDDLLCGEGGNDDLLGGRGKDDLRGGVGRDDLYGGSGRDILRGGNGFDKFIFKSKGDSGVTAAACDVITDFLRGDKIDFSAIDANAKAAGNQRFKFVAELTGKAGELEWDRTSKGFKVSGDVDGDGKADFSVQVNSSVVKLYGSDFLL
ncbi:calcium-binding protein [Microvirga splendida]|uniref:Calcium-binding protein n=1 Tax=Microvirga splendida TaxID=2795727 RepID=A0ABS0Y240_9HYPH|nr:hypothetical protein [Microvirga splendida]MBJ6126373.1 hypothetical protein [Microvirga splendida]